MRIQGHRIEESRKKKGLSQQELALAIGTGQTNISRWERDGVNDLKANHMRGLLKALGVTEAYLRGESDSDAPPPTPKTAEPAGIPAKSNPDWRVRIEKALVRALDRDRHTLQDVDAVRAMVGETAYFPPDFDAERAAGAWLDACAQLREAGLPATSANVAVAVMALPAVHTTIPATSPHTSSPPAMEATGIKRAARRRG